ncbi:MAG TPA: anthranilate phosphoribosyltransferase, partial [Armatimonadota bacterium]|nr:anthranilate phosphoribosyltransferase [Armatimonadota bacterium]
LLTAVVEGRHLSTGEAAAAMRHMISGEASPALTGALLTALRMKGETADEITGFAEGMRHHAVGIEPRCERLVDTCGTGGGDIRTFNISTTAAFVVAGAGVSVAKHGNRAMSSTCGSADLLEALGVRIDLSPERVCRCIEEVGIGFLFAQAHHPAMRHVAAVRGELPFRTVFNCLGPLTNPAGARAQLVGVYEERLVPLLAEVLLRLGCERALVVHGRDGLDELSTLGPSSVAEVRDGSLRLGELMPEELGLPRARPADIAPGHTVQENAAISRALLSGQPGPRREIVLLNAAAALVAAGAAADLREALGLAAESLDSGAAHARLEALVAATNG